MRSPVGISEAVRGPMSRRYCLGAAIDTNDRTTFPDLDDVRVRINTAEGWRGALMLAPECGIALSVGRSAT
jgi:hypothetical protein